VRYALNAAELYIGVRRLNHKEAVLAVPPPNENQFGQHQNGSKRGFSRHPRRRLPHLAHKSVCQHKTGPKLGENGTKMGEKGRKRDETHFYRIDPVFVQIDARQKQGHLITLSVHSRPLFAQPRAIFAILTTLFAIFSIFVHFRHFHQF